MFPVSKRQDRHPFYLSLNAGFFIIGLTLLTSTSPQSVTSEMDAATRNWLTAALILGSVLCLIGSAIPHRNDERVADAFGCWGCVSIAGATGSFSIYLFKEHLFFGTLSGLIGFLSIASLWLAVLLGARMFSLTREFAERR